MRLGAIAVVADAGFAEDVAAGGVADGEVFEGAGEVGDSGQSGAGDAAIRTGNPKLPRLGADRATAMKAPQAACAACAASEDGLMRAGNQFQCQAHVLVLSSVNRDHSNMVVHFVYHYFL